MRAIVVMGLFLLAQAAMGGQMYEWRDARTGALKLGDRPPADAPYWREGEMKPEEEAAQKAAERERALAQEEMARIAVKAEAAKIAAESGQATDRTHCVGDPRDLGAHIGMTQEQFRACFGFAPDKINKTVTAGRTVEQWVYRFGAADTRYFYFSDGVLTAMQK